MNLSPGSLVISLLMDRLFRSLTGSEGETDLTSLQNLDIQAMKESLALM